MNSPKQTARIAGVLYVLSGALGIFSYQYIPRTLIVPGDATATANNILASEMLFRIGIISELISTIALLLLVRALYRLLNGVNKDYASLMVTLLLASVPISFLNVLNEIAALTLLHGANFLSVFGQSQLDSFAMLFLGLHSAGIVVANIFWGLWLFPFGVLVIKSGSIPRIIGVLLISACLAYVSVSSVYLLAPSYASIVSLAAILPEAAGEGSIVVWLLAKGG